jgi:hypothetical protein
MTMDMDQEWARWNKLYERRYDPQPPVSIKDQPRESFFDYDITDSGYDMREPYVPRRRGVGAAEVLMFLVVVGLCVPIVARVALWIAEAIA